MPQLCTAMAQIPDFRHLKLFHCWMMAAFQLADGSEIWSEASSLDGRVSGEHYETSVRHRLWGLESATVAANAGPAEEGRLLEMIGAADRESKILVGDDVWNRICGKFPPTERRRITKATVDLHGEVQGTRSITEVLGPAACLLSGNDSVSGKVVAEITVMSALLLIKSAQLECFLTLSGLQGPQGTGGEHALFHDGVLIIEICGAFKKLPKLQARRMALRLALRRLSSKPVPLGLASDQVVSIRESAKSFFNEVGSFSPSKYFEEKYFWEKANVGPFFLFLFFAPTFYRSFKDFYWTQQLRKLSTEEIISDRYEWLRLNMLKDEVEACLLAQVAGALSEAFPSTAVDFLLVAVLVDRFLIWTDLWSNMPLETCDIGAVPSRYVCLLDPPSHEVMEAPAALAGPKMPKARRSVPIVLAFLASAAAAAYWAPVWVGGASRQPRRTDLVKCHSTQHVSLPNPQNIEARRNYPEYKFDEDGGMYDIIKYPLLTAKACRLLEEYNIYTFMVDRKANKPQIRAAIETIFGVKVIKCNTLIPSSRYQIAYGMKIGRKSLFKKAYVQVKEGDSIDLFPDDPEAV
ncbi:rplW [Symbiodinium microadriaticum]|nr:rplW [Symbiodinium microadriaticum]